MLPKFFQVLREWKIDLEFLGKGYLRVVGGGFYEQCKNRSIKL